MLSVIVESQDNVTISGNQLRKHFNYIKARANKPLEQKGFKNLTKQLWLYCLKTQMTSE